MEVILFSIGALLLGVMIGLLPSLPVFLAPMLILPFAQQISPEAMIMTWMLALLGSQYFGSVAAITTRIPGEDNTLIYINDIKNLSVVEKINLIRGTALGSLIAGLIGVSLLYVLFHWLHLGNMSFFSLSWVQLLIYSSVIVSFVIAEKKHWWTAILLSAIGILIGTNNNYSIPSWWITTQRIFDDTTIFMIMLGLVIIPHCFESYDLGDRIQNYKTNIKEKFPWATSLKSSFVGFLAGMIPGPSTYIGAYAGYSLARGDSKTRIIAAETANNSAAVATALPFFLTAIPINQATMLLVAAFELKQVNITEVIWQESVMGVSVLDQLLLAIVASSIIFYFLSTNFIKLYVGVIEFFHKKISLVLIALISAMCLADISISGINHLTYLTFLAIFSTLGLILRRYNVNAIPLLFGLIVGDRLVWSFLQFTNIYF
jgi:putative tricarboxylic transport membrane protein